MICIKPMEAVAFVSAMGGDACWISAQLPKRIPTNPDMGGLLGHKLQQVIQGNHGRFVLPTRELPDQGVVQPRACALKFQSTTEFVNQDFGVAAEDFCMPAFAMPFTVRGTGTVPIGSASAKYGMRTAQGRPGFHWKSAGTRVSLRSSVQRLRETYLSRFYSFPSIADYPSRDLLYSRLTF